MAKEGLLARPPRIRFNWGYHDGANETLRGHRRLNMATHFDKIYAQGYEYGADDATTGEYNGNSDKAWESRASLRQAPWMPHRRYTE